VYNKASDYTGAYASANSMFDAAANRLVYDICCRYVTTATKWYLAYCFDEADNFSSCASRVGWYDIAGTTLYNSDDLSAQGAHHCTITAEGGLFIARGPQVLYIEDAHTIAADDFLFESGVGNLDTDFDSGITDNPLWQNYYESNLSNVALTGAGGDHLNISMDIDDDTSVVFLSYGGLVQGLFDVQLTGLAGTEPTLNGTEEFTRELRVQVDESGWYARIYLKRYTDGTTKSKIYHEIHNGVGVVSSANIDLGAVAPTDSWKLRIERTLSATPAAEVIKTYYDTGSGWTQLGTTYNTFSTDPCVILPRMTFTDLDTESCEWDIYELTDTDQPVAFDNFTAGKTITGMDAFKPSGGSKSDPYVAVCFDDDGAGVITYDTSSAKTSFVDLYQAAGILSSDNVVAVAVDQVFDHVWCATTDIGIDVVDAYAGTLDGTIDDDFGKAIDTQIKYLSYVGSFAYGTGAGAGTLGGGFLSSTAHLPPADTDIYARAVMDDSGNMIIITGCLKPADADYNHSVLYRRINGGAWNFLRDNGTSDPTWDTAGTKYQFAVAFEDFLVFQDLDLSDSKYEYKWAHVDDGDNESSGAITEAVFLDEPIITGSAYLDTDTSTRGRFVQITPANSGGDSGNESGKVFMIKVEQVGGTLDPVYHLTDELGALPWILQTTLEGTDGTKTIRCTPYDVLGQAGAADDTDFVYVAPTTTGIVFDRTPNMMLCYRIVSDDLTWVSNSEYTSAFPATNLVTSPLNEAWRGKDIDTETGGVLTNFEYVLYQDMISSTQRDVFFLANHNFESDYLASCSIYLCGSSANWGTSASAWFANSEKRVNLSTLTQYDVLLHRPEWSYRYWAILIYATANDATDAALYRPYVGRAGLVQSSHIWQPAINPRDGGMKRRHRDESIIYDTKDQPFRSQAKDQRSRYALPWNFPLQQFDWRSMETIFQTFGKSGDMLLIVNPDDYKTDETAPGAFSYTNAWDPLLFNFEREPEFVDFLASKSTFALALREIAGAGSGQ
jgi:hypothetical protein